jgi:hypothetical protein
VPTSGEYRLKALVCLEEARRATHPTVREELANLALAYVRLSILAEQNAAIHPLYETLPKPRVVE